MKCTLLKSLPITAVHPQHHWTIHIPVYNPHIRWPNHSHPLIKHDLTIPTYNFAPHWLYPLFLTQVSFSCNHLSSLSNPRIILIFYFHTKFLFMLQNGSLNSSVLLPSLTEDYPQTVFSTGRKPNQMCQMTVSLIPGRKNCLMKLSATSKLYVRSKFSFTNAITLQYESSVNGNKYYASGV